MRFREFNPLLEFAPPSGSITSRVLNIIKSTEENSPVYKSAVDLLQQIISTANKNKQIQSGVPPVTESVSSKFISDAEAAEQGLTPAQRQFFEKKYANLEQQAEQKYQQGKIEGGEEKTKEIQQFFSGLEDQLKILASKAAPTKAIEKEIVTRFKGSFTDLVLRDQKITQEDLQEFLQAGIDGQVINMLDLVKTSTSGNLEKYIDEKYKKIIGIIKDDIFGYVPPGTGANMGPGEVALTMFGNPAKKGDVGDLDIGGVMYEIKGAKPAVTSGTGQSGSGGRLNGTRVQKPTTGFKIINDYFAKNLPDVDPTYKNIKGKTISKFNWNAKGINLFNQTVVTNIPNLERRRKFVMNFILELWGGLITNHNEIKNFEDMLISTVDLDEGTIDIQQAISTVTKLLYLSYKLSNGHPVPGMRDNQMFIIVLNASSLNYQIIKTTKDFDKIKIAGSINWTDANQSTSPQLFLA